MVEMQMQNDHSRAATYDHAHHGVLDAAHQTGGTFGVVRLVGLLGPRRGPVSGQDSRGSPPTERRTAACRKFGVSTPT